MRKNKLLTILLSFALVVAASLTATMGIGSLTAKAEGKTEVAVAGSALSISSLSSDHSSRLHIKVDGSDWASAGSSDLSITTSAHAASLNTFSKITFDGAAAANYAAVDGYFNLWSAPEHSQSITINSSATEIVFAAGTELPSYAFASTGNGDVYVLSEKVKFTRPDASSTSWTKVVGDFTPVDVTNDVSVVAAHDCAAYQNGYNVTRLILSFGSHSALAAVNENFYLNDNPSKNGVDLAQYVYINDKSVRSILVENVASNTYKHASLFPMKMGGKYAPVTLHVGATVDLRIMGEYIPFATEAFTVTVKSGLEWNTANGETLKVTEDKTFSFDYRPAQKPEVSVSADKFSVRDSIVDAGDSVIYTIVSSDDYMFSSNWLMDHYTGLQKYITVNGLPVEQINENTDDSYEYTSFPATLGGDYAVPVRVNCGKETKDGSSFSRINIYIHKDYIVENPVQTVGLKVGFDIEDDASVYKLASDVELAVYYEINYVKKDGSNEIRKVAYGTEIDLIGLPLAADGYTSAWVSDGEYETMPAKNLTYVETYSLITYTVTFVNGENTVGTADYDVEHKDIDEPDVPARDHYTGAWETYTLTFGDITVKAVYTAVEYKVVFKADGQIVDTKIYTIEDDTVVLPAVPEKNGYDGDWAEFELSYGDDVIVNAVYTEKEGESSSETDSKDTSSDKDSSSSGGGCFGTISGSAVAVIGLAAALFIGKKKED